MQTDMPPAPQSQHPDASMPSDEDLLAFFRSHSLPDNRSDNCGSCSAQVPAESQKSAFFLYMQPGSVFRLPLCSPDTGHVPPTR